MEHSRSRIGMRDYDLRVITNEGFPCLPCPDTQKYHTICVTSICGFISFRGKFIANECSKPLFQKEFEKWLMGFSRGFLKDFFPFSGNLRMSISEFGPSPALDKKRGKNTLYQQYFK